MRVVFMGTPAFAVPTLQALAARHEVVGVYTRPDAVSGRGSLARPSAVKTAALELGLDVREPATLRDPVEESWLSSAAPDVIVVAAYGLILPPAVLAIPRHGCINVHASLLPRWRGAAPIERAILAGDEEVGVSIMRMEAGLDTGPFAAKAAIPADDLTAGQITAALADAGASALLDVLEAIESGSVEWSSQDDSLATYAAKVTDADTMLSPELPADDLVRRVRASSRRAPARLVVGGTPMSVVSASLSECVVEAGHVSVSKRELALGTVDGAVALHRVKPDGKPEMDASAWARGARIEARSTWGPAS